MDVIADPDDRPGAALLAEAQRLTATSTLGWNARRRRALLEDLDRAVTLLAAARAAVLVAERDSGDWRGHGDPSFEAWRARTSRAGRPAAVAEVRRAEAWVGMPAVRDAVVAREAALEHVDVLGRLAAGASAPVREAIASDAGQAELAAMARRSDAATFARSVARWAAAHDASAHERDHQAQRAARFLHLSESGAGTHVRGLLDRMAGHRLRLALEAASPRPAVDDDRSSEQRRADALESLADRALDAPTASGSAARPHVSVVMSPETWRALRESAGARRASTDEDRRDTGGHGVAAAAPGGTPPAALEDGTPIPPSELARALCDCELTRVVAGADSLPMDLGRTQRTYTGAQRRAVIVRDGGCGWPGCGAPARWCEVHHIRWWDRDGGATSVENGVLLCSFHHHEVHRQQLDIRREPVRPVPADRAGGRASPSYVFTAPNGRVVAPEVTPAVARIGEPARADDGARTGALGQPADRIGRRVGDDRARATQSGTSGRPAGSPARSSRRAGGSWAGAGALTLELHDAAPGP